MNIALLERRGLTNFVRLSAAIAVLISHSYPLTGTGPDPLIFKISVGDFAVSVFFVISGYFIYTSSCKHSIMNYLILRFARIFPPLLFVNAFVVFIMAYFLNKEAGFLKYLAGEPSNPLVYFFRNSFLLGGLQPGILKTFGEQPFAYVVNGSLWSLPIEVKCYAICMILGYFARRSLRHILLYVCFSLTLLLYWIELGTTLPVEDLIPQTTLRLLVTFFSGAIVTRVSLTRLVQSRTLNCLIPASVILIFLNYRPLAPILYSVLIPWLAILPFKFTDLFRKLKDHDFSFGFYLWSFPIQQLVLYLEGQMTPVRLSILGFTFTMITAVFSWNFIEKPSMKFARSNFIRK